MERKFAAVATSFGANLVCLGAATQVPPQAGWIVTGAVFYGLGTVLGLNLGIWLGRQCIGAVALGAFLAALVLSIPVILVTYGFALLGVPFVVAYVIVVTAGAYLGARRKERRSATA
ncbi:MAG: hypothetical protein ACAH21_02340 [Ramlibacter sp.]